jgi:hypothetical protein
VIKRSGDLMRRRTYGPLSNGYSGSVIVRELLDRAVCEEAATVSALSGKMIRGTMTWCERSKSKWT